MANAALCWMDGTTSNNKGFKRDITFAVYKASTFCGWVDNSAMVWTNDIRAF